MTKGSSKSFKIKSLGICMYCKGQEVFGKRRLESIAQRRQKDTPPLNSHLFNDYKPKCNKYSNILVINK